MARANWRKFRIGELLRIKHGYAFKGAYFSSAGPFIVLTPGNFLDEGGFKSKEDKEKHYTGPVPEEFILSQGDLLVAMTEQAEGLLGSTAIVPKDRIYLHNQRLGLITELKPDGIDKMFLYYLFNSREVRSQIRASAAGVKVRHTSPSRIYEVQVTIPSITTQRKIAGILAGYDQLMENNRRRIGILEDMARALYREWFVGLRFPGFENVPLVNSVTGLMPEGWEVRPIGQVIETLGGGTPSTKQPEYWIDGNIPWFTPTDLTSTGAMFVSQSSRMITRKGLERSSATLFPAYSVMMTSRATIGVVAINTKEACTNQGFITCIPNERVSAYQLYFWIQENKEAIMAVASGATYKEINRTEFRDFPIAIASPEANTRFIEVMAPIGKQIENLLAQNANLRRARDLLLPRLVSGELNVTGLAIDTGELNE